MENIKLFEAFAGIGTQRMALRNIGVDFEIVGISEIDKYAIKSYEAIHGSTKNFGDITKINPECLPDFDLFTYSFPCQDLSTAGKQQGLVKGKTRSGLLYECEKIIEVKLPKYLLLENVKALVGKKFKPQFDKWLKYLESLGYTNYWQVLNSKDYGIPQNRERVFVISILNDKEKTYTFPQTQILNICLKDLLEDQVEDKYYINKKWHFTQPDEQKHDSNEIAQINGIKYKATRSIGDINKLCRTIDTMSGGQREPKVLVGNRVRKLTPKECWRLMGCSDEDFEKAQQVNSNSQLYKQAGNAIVVNVLEEIFKNLFKD